MADNVWENNDADNDANVANNWSLGWVPKTGDTMVLDGTSTDNCQLSGAISCDAISVTAAYSGILDFNDYAVTTSGNQTYAGTGTVDCGASTITCAGDFDNASQTTWTRGTSTVVLTGTSKTLTSNNRYTHNLTISGTITLSGAHVCYGTLTIDTGKSFSGAIGFATMVINGLLACPGYIGTLQRAAGSITVGASGSITTGTNGSITPGYIAACSLFDNSAGGSVTATVSVKRNCSIKGIFSGKFTYNNSYVYDTTLTLTFAGDVTFNGGVTFSGDSGSSGVANVDAATNDVNVTFGGDVTFTEDEKTVAWNKAATGDVTFNGTTDYTDSTAAIQNLGNVVVDGTSLTLSSEMECDSFTGTAGTLTLAGETMDVGGNVDLASGFLFGDPAGGTIYMTGNFTADGNDLTSGSAKWYLSVDGTAVASGVGDVDYCDADGYTEIDATSGPWVDSSNNVNWNFGSSPAVDTNAMFLVM